MSNVISVKFSSPKTRKSEGIENLTTCFAQYRRSQEDVFWLKENGELLNILETSGTSVSPDALEVYQEFYDTIEDRFAFFPQYYRFLISITADLEDLGLVGDRAERLIDKAQKNGLIDAELSDLQRAEARRLYARRMGQGAHADLGARLLDFTARTETFAIPNKKAAYEPTHIVFYLTDYGRQTFDFPSETITSLLYVGLVALIDQNADLLAEVCLALRYAGEVPPEQWEHWAEAQLDWIAIEAGESVSIHDNYHEYFVLNWYAACSGAPAFEAPYAEGRTGFYKTQNGPSALSGLSRVIYQMGSERQTDWHVMRGHVADQLDPTQVEIIEFANQSSDQFDAFFEGFARVATAT